MLLAHYEKQQVGFESKSGRPRMALMHFHMKAFEANATIMQEMRWLSWHLLERRVKAAIHMHAEIAFLC